MASGLSEKLLIGAKEVGVEIGQIEAELFLKYLDLLHEWNQNINLTAITDPQEIVVKHFLDSIALIPALDKKPDLNLLDVGTGAGFPGIPLKIAYPALNVVLLDSLNKRVNFLNEVIMQLGLSGIRAVHGRAEDYAKNNEYRESFDVVSSRAVARLSVLSELCLPFVKVGGIFASYKGLKAQEEVVEAGNALSELGGEVDREIEVKLPGIDDKRYIVMIKKVRATPKKYPRKAGTPEKKPL